MMTRLFIYLLAMMTGFSAAEAARPVSAAPDAAVGRAYAAAVVNVAEAANDQSVSAVPFAAAPSVALPVVAAFSAIAPTTPILRHDVILG